jgi:hypothetical protein
MALANDEENGNPLRRWFASQPNPEMNRLRFSKAIGISHSYLSQLCSDRPPWPTRRILRDIERLTNGEVLARHMLYLPDPERHTRPAKKKAA